MIAKLDHALMRFIFIPISQFAGKRYGSTCGSLSRAAIYPVVVFGTLQNVFTSPHTLAGDGPRELMLLMLACLFWIGSIVADNTPNVFEYEPPLRRIFWIICLSFNLSKTIDHGLQIDVLAGWLEGIACVVVIYFRAVPKPPRKKEKHPRAARLGWATWEGAI